MSEVNNLPENWKHVKLGEVCKTTSGGTPNRGNSAYYGGNIPWVKSGELDKGLITDTEEKITEDALKNCSAKMFPKGTLLIALYGATIGKLAFLGIEAATNQAICGIFESDKINSKFLYNFLLYKKPGLVKQSFGGAQPNISQAILRNLELPLPSKETQAAIVSKIEELFSELDNGIENLRTAQQQLKTYRQSVLKWAFEGKLTEEWRKNNLPRVRIPLSPQLKQTSKQVAGSSPIVDPKNKLVSKSKSISKKQSVPEERFELPQKKGHARPPSEFKQDFNWIDNEVPRAGTEPVEVPRKGFELSQLPEGWNLAKLSEICKIIGGVTKGKDFKGKKTIYLPYLRVANVQDGYLKLKEMKTIEVLPDDKAKYKLEFGDILYTEGGDKDKLGRGTIWENEIPDCIHQNHVFRARPLSAKLNSWYIAYFSQTRLAKNYFYKHGKQTTNLASINLTILSNLPIPICSTEEQSAIVGEIESRLSVADKLEETISQSLQQAEALRQSILKRAFEGKLITETVKKETPAFKPKNPYFYQIQMLGYVLKVSKEKQINHGEMTAAKYVYLLDRLYGVPSLYKFKRLHLGPYPVEMKKVINNKTYFKLADNTVEVLAADKLFKYSNPYQTQIESAVTDLANIFSKYQVKDRPRQTELLATVCKVIEDIQTMDLVLIRASMKDWPIDLKTTSFKNKAEKFTEAETEKCLAFIIKQGWDKKLMN